MYEEIEAIASGSVQGVRYRDFVQGVATELGLGGFAENLPDGTVRVVAQGPLDTLKAFVDRLNEGSVLSEVRGVAVSWRTPDRQFDDFTIRS